MQSQTDDSGGGICGARCDVGNYSTSEFICARAALGAPNDEVANSIFCERSNDDVYARVGGVSRFMRIAKMAIRRHISRNSAVIRETLSVAYSHGMHHWRPVWRGLRRVDFELARADVQDI